MTKPDWAGPFGIPEDYDELEQFLLQSTLLALGALVAIEVGIRFTIPRMASHAFRNPSLAAIRAAAFRQVAWPSISRFAGIVFSSSPLVPMVIVAAVGTAAQYDVAAHHGAGTRGSLGSIAPSYHLVDSKPWWEQFW